MNTQLVEDDADFSSDEDYLDPHHGNITSTNCSGGTMNGTASVSPNKKKAPQKYNKQNKKGIQAASKTETTMEMDAPFDGSDLSRTGPHKDYYYDTTEINFFVNDVPIRFDPVDMMKMKIKPVQETIDRYMQQLQDPTVKSVALRGRTASSKIG